MHWGHGSKPVTSSNICPRGGSLGDTWMYFSLTTNEANSYVEIVLSGTKFPQDK